MNGLLAYLIGVVAVVLLLPILDRLRVMTWRTHRARFVLLHFLLALWLGCIAFEAVFFARVTPYQVAGLVPSVLWLVATWHTWRGAPPAHTRTAPMPLDGIPSRNH